MFAELPPGALRYSDSTSENGIVILCPQQIGHVVRCSHPWIKNELFDLFAIESLGADRTDSVAQGACYVGLRDIDAQSSIEEPRTNSPTFLPIISPFPSSSAIITYTACDMKRIRSYSINSVAKAAFNGSLSGWESSVIRNQLIGRGSVACGEMRSLRCILTRIE